MPSDSYMQIDGLKGESTAKDYKDWIEIQSFSHTMTQPASATASSAGGATYGRTKHEDFEITKEIDLSSPKLYEMCSSGKHIKKVVIDLLRSSGDAPVKYMSIEMDEVIVSKVSPMGNVGGAPTELVAFNYGQIKWTYTQQKRADGSKGGNVTGGWSLVENKTAA
jgi:type VI secretion system secreted protein Hcp